MLKKDFEKYFLPHLTTFTRGFAPKTPLHKIFNYILYCLHTGCQWEQIPINKDKNGRPEIHYTNVFKRFQIWANDGSLTKCFVNSVKVLHQKKKLKIDNLHGDGSNTVAKKGVKK
ncbi:MAG: transposase [Patescibacteria group bacterium]